MNYRKFMKYVYSATILGIVLALGILVTSNTLSSFGIRIPALLLVTQQMQTLHQQIQ